MVFVCGQQHVLGDVDLDAVALKDGVGGQDIDEAVEHVRARLREAGCDALTVGVRAALVIAAVRCGLGSASDDAESNGCSEDFEIVVVDLAFDTRFPGLIETLELIEIDGVFVPA